MLQVAAASPVRAASRVDGIMRGVRQKQKLCWLPVILHTPKRCLAIFCVASTTDKPARAANH